MTSGLRIDTDGDTSTVSWDHAQGSLRTLQNAVGGTFDVVQLTERLSMWVHDEGLYLYPENIIATHIVWTEIGQHQMFHGPAVFTGGVDNDGNTLPLESDAEQRIRDAAAKFQR